MKLLEVKKYHPIVGKGLQPVSPKTIADLHVNWNELDTPNLGNKHIVSLEGCPEHLPCSLRVYRNDLRDLKGCPKSIQGNFDVRQNHLTSLEGIHKQILKMHGGIWLDGNPITSHLFGVLFIEGLENIDTYDDDKFHPVSEILNVALNDLRSISDKLKRQELIYDVQEELISKGFEEYAKI